MIECQFQLASGPQEISGKIKWSKLNHFSKKKMGGVLNSKKKKVAKNGDGSTSKKCEAGKKGGVLSKRLEKCARNGLIRIPENTTGSGTGGVVRQQVCPSDKMESYSATPEETAEIFMTEKNQKVIVSSKGVRGNLKKGTGCLQN